MLEANDPINPVNPFVYLFGSFLAKIRKVQTSIKILLTFPNFPFKELPRRVSLANSVASIIDPKPVTVARAGEFNKIVFLSSGDGTAAAIELSYFSGDPLATAVKRVWKW